ncbi:MAG: hypothetical protein JWP01_2132 [Myxococcales bacterium]|nr:hypothetical protein [Myxococcales bacterium]
MSNRRWVVWLATVLASGCTERNPRNCDDGVCTDSAFPFCDTDGSVAGTPHTCIEGACTPLDFVSCSGNQAVSCNADGSNYEVESCASGCSEANRGCNSCTHGESRCVAGGVSQCGSDGLLGAPQACALGCVDAPSPHCAYIEPRYLPDICDVQATQAALTISNSGTLDTSLDVNCNGGIIPQTGAPDICVVHYGSITVESGKTLTVIGRTEMMYEGGRAVALVADDALSIDGALSLSAVGSQSGPGGGPLQSGPASTTNAQGGCGGSTVGGPGGSATADGGAMNGGAATMNPALLTALVGGANKAGGGGGAGTLISCHGKVSVSGIITSAGGGGWFFVLAGGGGAGGNVVLQGAQVSVTGEVYANGGGGAAGAAAGQTAGIMSGADGTSSDLSPALGGTSQGGGGRGGDGGTKSGMPRAGSAPTAAGGKPGGGGGSMGFFQTYTPMGVVPILTPSHSSPDFGPNETIRTR